MQCDKYFLDYMNYYLSKYQKENKVISIHGYNYPIKESKKIPNFSITPSHSPLEIRMQQYSSINNP